MTDIIDVLNKASELGCKVEVHVKEDAASHNLCYLSIANSKMEFVNIEYEYEDRDICNLKMDDINWAVSTGTNILGSGNDDLETVLEVMEDFFAEEEDDEEDDEEF